MKTRWIPVALVALVACACSRETGTSGTDVSKLKALHRGELSAVASYEQALDKISDASVKPELTRIRDEHKEAAAALRNRITALAAKPDENAGPWGEWAKIVAGGAAAIKDEAGLSALKTGEKHGVDEYQEALNDPKVDAETKTLVRDSLLERQRAHIDAIQRLQKQT